MRGRNDYRATVRARLLVPLGCDLASPLQRWPFQPCDVKPYLTARRGLIQQQCAFEAEDLTLLSLSWDDGPQVEPS